jgi:fructokinase
MADAICMGELLIDFVPVTTGTDLLTATAFHKALGGRAP